MINNNNIRNKSVSLSDEQIDFIDNQSRGFSLSKFVRDRLDRYMSLVNEKEKLIQGGDVNEETINRS